MKLTDSELENLMIGENIEPSAQWQSIALDNIKKTVTENENIGINNSNLNFISNIMNKRKFIVIGIVFSALIATVGVTGLAVLTLRSPQKALDQKNILEQISLNNPSFTTAQTSRSNLSTMNESYAAGDVTSSKLIAPGLPYISDFNYSYSKTTITRGPAFNSCSYGMDQSEVLFVPTYESFNYYDEGSSYSKYTSYDNNNQVTNYYLSSSTQTEAKYTYQNIIYFGGSYAVRMSGEYDNSIQPLSVSTEPSAVDDSMLRDESTKESVNDSVSSDTTLPTEPINYFGDTAEVLRTETINGKQYYVIQTSYQTDCSGYVNLNRWDNQTVEDNRTMYSLTYANTEDYQILKTETYVDSVNAGNLVESTEITSQNTNIDFASVSSNFNFEFNVPVKDIEVDTTTTIEYDPAAEIQKSMEYIKSENLTVLVPAESVINQYAYFNYNTKGSYLSEIDSYYSDRNFYPAGALGDEMFNSFNGLTSISTSVLLAQGSVSYSKDETSYTVTIYSADEDEKDILNSMLWSDIQNKSEAATTVTVNGTSVAANLYSYEIDQPSIMPYVDYMEGSVPYECTEDCFRKQYVLVFSYGNNKYSLVESSFNYGTVESVFDTVVDGSFTAYTPSNTADLAKIEQLVTSSMNGTYVDGGVIEPALPL